MFLLGIFVQRNILKILPYIEGKWYIYTGLFIVSLMASNIFSLKITGNGIHPIPYFFLIAMMLSIAFSKRSFADHLLKRNDISYGTYIIHMPIINIFVELNYTGYFMYAVYACLITLLLAMASWTFIEKPALQRKKYIHKTTAYMK